jgi:hypothetical protein
VLHIAGFMMLCEGFLGIDPHANLFWAFFYSRALSAKGDPELASVGGFGLHKRVRRPGDYRRTPLRTRTGGGMKSGSTSGTWLGTRSRRGGPLLQRRRA